MSGIKRESIEDALENDRCGICGSVDHFREDCPLTAADRAKAAEVTQADVNTAVQVRPHYPPCDFPDNPCSCGAAEDRRAIAAAIAAARADAEARWVAAVEGLAEEWETEAQRHDDAEPISSDGLTRMILAARHCREHAARLRGLTTSSEEEQ